MSVPLAPQCAALIDQVRAARDRGDELAERQALAELLQVYERLGRREIGTVDEQNFYIVGRHMGLLPEPLQELGLAPDDVPMPPDRRRPAPPPQAPAAEDAARIGERFARITPDTPEERFTTAHRPEDGQLYDGRPAPWAVIDTTDGLPVAWYPERDWADHTADTANLLRSRAR